MRLLFVHSDHLAFETTRKVTDDLAGVDGAPMEGRMEDCLTAFISVESGDADDVAAVVANAADELRDVETTMSFVDLVEPMDEDVGDLPRRPRYMPARVSDHPNFTNR